MLKNRMLLMGMLMMTAPSEGNVGAAGNIADDVNRLPDTTEGNRGPSRTANSSGNSGDPTVELHGDAGTVVDSAEDAPTIPNSTNAVTELAFARLSPTGEVVVKMDRTIAKEFDIRPLFVDVLGTTNVEKGPMNSAFRSINFKYPDAHGQRACIAYRDGTVKFLASGTSYDDWYNQSRDESVAFAAIVYFDQNKQSKNPFVSIRWYKKAELPEVTDQGNDDL